MRNESDDETITQSSEDTELQRFQNRAARIIASANYETNSADVLESLGWETLEKFTE